MTTVLMISPGYPAEMALFTRGLAAVGARVIGIGDQATGDLPPASRDALTHYERVGSLADTGQVLSAVHQLIRTVSVDQVECLWEPYMLLAAAVREQFGLPGMTVEQTRPFRDKELMKQQLDAAGIRTPHHASTRTVGGAWEAAERIGYPLIVKPIAGAGSADTYRVDDAGELDAALQMIRHVPEISVEEFVEAEEFTYDTVCAGGRILFDNICLYRPRPLQARQHEWISPVTMALRNLDVDYLAGGRAMGAAVLSALGFTDGFTHMEWYRKADGEVVFGEIGARPPGARTTDLMNYVVDADLFTGWADAVVNGRISQRLERQFNAASIFKRAKGSGRITAVTGLDGLLQRYGDSVVTVDLLPIGAHRRDWRATLISDGMVVVRHPELSVALEIADAFARDLELYAE